MLKKKKRVNNYVTKQWRVRGLWALFGGNQSHLWIGNRGNLWCGYTQLLVCGLVNLTLSVIFNNCLIVYGRVLLDCQCVMFVSGYKWPHLVWYQKCMRNYLSCCLFSPQMLINLWRTAVHSPNMTLGQKLKICSSGGLRKVNSEV